eukprot:686397_1
MNGQPGRGRGGGGRVNAPQRVQRQNGLPLPGNQMPQGQNQMPQGQNQMPLLGSQMPQRQNQMQQGKNQMQQRQNQMPQRQNQPKSNDWMGGMNNGQSANSANAFNKQQPQASQQRMNSQAPPKRVSTGYNAGGAQANQRANSGYNAG